MKPLRLRFTTPALLALLLRPAPGAEIVEEPLRNPAWTGRTMGSTYAVKAAGSSLDAARLEKVKAEVDRLLVELNRQMSHYQPDSELSRFNASTSTVPCQVSSAFAEVMRFATALHRDSGGVSDPSLGLLINVWGFGQRGSRLQPPPEGDVRHAWALTGCGHLHLTVRGELQKDLPALQLNLSSFVPGYAADQVAGLLRTHGLSNVFVEIGGEIRALGDNARGEKWRVGIEAPDSEAPPGEVLQAVVGLSNAGLATAGDYRIYYRDADGQPLGHILDPRTGHPVRHDVASVTVIAPTALEADGYDTALFVMGVEAGLKWIEARTNAAAMFIVREETGRFRIVTSSRFPRFETRAE